MENYDKTQTGQEAEQELKKVPSSAKQAYRTAKKAYKNKEKIKSVAQKTGQLVKKIIIHIINALLSITQLFISTVGIPVLIIVVVILMVTFALFSWNANSFSSFDDFENALGETCKVTYTDTYEIIQENYLQKQNELAEKIESLLVEKYGSDNNHNFSISNLSYTCDSGGLCTITGSLSNDADEDGDGYTDHVYKTNINYSINVTDGSGGSLADSIVGYIEANYTVIKVYNENYETLQESIKNATVTFVQFGKETKDGQTMTEDLCNSLGGELYAKGCKYEYVPTTKTETVTGTCTYNGGSWSNSGEDGHECSTEAWKKNSSSSLKEVTCKLDSSTNKYIDESGTYNTECGKLSTSGAAGSAQTRKIKIKQSGSDEPVDGSSYTYKYQKEIDLTDKTLENFDLDIYKNELQEYINKDKLFFMPNDDSLTETINDTSKTKNETTTSDYDEEHTETVSDGVYACSITDKTTKLACENSGGIWDMGTKEETISVNVKVEEVNITSSDISLAIYTKIDADDPDNFLYEEKQTCLKNIEKLNEVNGSNESADYTYSETINEVVQALNFACPDTQINLNLITGASYSGFSAISSAVDAPGIFGNSDYWYDSSNGVWDYTQIARKDVYNAVWSYAATGAGVVSGWWNGSSQVGTPQCTDFAHARFYAQYGFQCGNGNGQDIARNTVAKYPNKFTNGIDSNGKLHLKAGSIISKPGEGSNPYGHVGFIEAVETDDSGNITSITISDANFYKVPGGIRMHCVYTWEQYVSAWGLNCTFAVPID